MVDEVRVPACPCKCGLLHWRTAHPHLQPGTTLICLGPHPHAPCLQLNHSGYGACEGMTIIDLKLFMPAPLPCSLFAARPQWLRACKGMTTTDPELLIPTPMLPVCSSITAATAPARA